MDSISYYQYIVCKYHNTHLNISIWRTVVKGNDIIILAFVGYRVRAVHFVFDKEVPLGLLD